MTDADLLLGWLDAESPLAGGVRLDAEAAAGAVGALAGELGLSADEAAAGIARVAAAEMAQAVRVVTVERGIDPRELALVAFGGAGPLHAAQIADGAGHAASGGAARVRGPVGAGPDRVGAAPGRGGERAAQGRRRSPASGSAKPSRAWASGRRENWAKPMPRCA